MRKTKAIDTVLGPLLDKIGIPRRRLIIAGDTAVYRPYLFSTGNDNAGTWEHDLRTATAQYVKHGDDVVIIGGGFGSCTVKAAEHNGDGYITVYEPSPERYRWLNKTLSANNISDGAVETVNAAVGGIIDAPEDAADADTISTIPACDALIIDAEGAEIQILEHLSVSPRVIVVECHNGWTVGERRIRDLLAGNGYSVVERLNEDEANQCPILVAERQ